MKIQPFVVVGLSCTMCFGVRAALAQACNTSDARWAVLASAGRTDRPGADGLEGWTAGARVEWNPQPSFAAHAAYQHEWPSGAGVHALALGLGANTRLPGRPCIALDAMVALGKALGAGDFYRNATIPLSVVFGSRVGAKVVAPFAGVEAIFSATDASLLGYSLSKQSFGVGMLAGIRSQSGRLLTTASVHLNTLANSLGPQPLAHIRGDVGIGLRL